MTRHEFLKSFVEKTEWADANIQLLAGDASNRKYYRLERMGDTAVLMDAPPETGEDVRPFLEIVSVLNAAGLAPPKIYASDTKHGFILMQDFGDDLFFDVVKEKPDLELQLYTCALDVLNKLHKKDLTKSLSPYGINEMSSAAGLAAAWFAQDTSIEIERSMRVALARLDWSNPVLVHRDFHAQNLIWRPNESGNSRVGILDFQDAQAGHPLYDAASLINDARRDLNTNLKQKLIDKLSSEYTGDDDFQLAFQTVSAQRNLRILGVFARLCMRDGKVGYVDLIPRVWNNLWSDLDHPELAELSKTAKQLPNPTPEFLQGLKEKCGTLQAA